MMPSLFSSPPLIFTFALLLRAGLLCYGLYQDTHSAMKYTDIDYMVFTDAARFVSRGHPPYARDTYRYTPLLAWMLVPTTWSPQWAWFSFGKILFAISDIVAGWLLLRLLRDEMRIPEKQALKLASIWLLNPMVATISTRGSSEGLLGVMVIALLWAVMRRKIVLAGILLGLGVHFKIYPFIYAPSIIWWLDEQGDGRGRESSLLEKAMGFITPARVTFTLWALSTFSALNLAMYALYGLPFMQHTYLHHLTRIDHRHNFSPYNTLLYLSAAAESPKDGVQFESLAFIPQLFLSAIAIPLVLAKKDLAGTMLAQTFAFVAFNKVCTSQYFLWYLVFLPLYLPSSLFLRKPVLGISAAVLWVAAQGVWLHQGFRLEFLGISTFVPGLWLASLGFFAVNVWILGIIVVDVGTGAAASSSAEAKEREPISTVDAAATASATDFDARKRKVVQEYMDQLETSQ